MTLSKTQIIQSRMIEWLVNNELERMCNEAVMVKFKVLPGICLEGLRKATKSLSEDSVPPGTALTTQPRSSAVQLLRDSLLNIALSTE
jgi:hypothetical protein